MLSTQTTTHINCYQTVMNFSNSTNAAYNIGLIDAATQLFDVDMLRPPYIPRCRR